MGGVDFSNARKPRPSSTLVRQVTTTRSHDRRKDTTRGSMRNDAIDCSVSLPANPIAASSRVPGRTALSAVTTECSGPHQL